MIKNQSANMYIRKINLVCLVGLFLSARIARTIILEPSDNLQAIYEGDSVTFRCEVEKPWAVANGSCMISHLSHPKLKICQHFSNFSSNCKDFQGRSYYTSSDVMNKHLCGLTLNNVKLEDRGKWKCSFHSLFQFIYNVDASINNAMMDVIFNFHPHNQLLLYN